MYGNASSVGGTACWNQTGGAGGMGGVGGGCGGAPPNGSQGRGPPSIPPIGEHIQYITLIVYLTTFVVGLAGNSLVIYIIARYKDVRRKSVANFYILNLALADELYTLALPMFCYATWTRDWVFGNPMCKIMTVIREINKFASIFTLVALSLDRYVASYHTLGHFRTLTIGKCICLSIWVASILMCMPYLLYYYSIDRPDGSAVCKPNWPRRNYLGHLRSWTYSQITIGLIVPFALICASYFLLMHRLKAIMKPRLSQRIRKPNRKMTRTVLVVVIGSVRDDPFCFFFWGGNCREARLRPMEQSRRPGLRKSRGPWACPLTLEISVSSILLFC